MSIVGIRPEKLAALLEEGFTEDYLKDIMQVKPCPKNPKFDLNSEARQMLGLDGEYNRAAVSMSNWEVSVTAPRRMIDVSGRRNVK